MMASDQKPVPLLDRDGLQKALGLHGFWGRCLTRVVYSILGMDGVNKLYMLRVRPDGPDFSSGLLEDIGVQCDILPEQMENIPLEGGFITVSNHHYGAVDGLILNAYIGKKRPDYKIITTYFLSLIPNLKENFIPVDNFTRGGVKSVSGIKEALGHIRSGGALGLFPAGEVATWQKKGLRTALGKKRVVEDKPWTDNMMKLILKSGLPVVPVFFDGGNSRLFHLLGLIHPRLRTLRLPREMTGAGGKTVKVRIGQPIPASKIASFDEQSLGKYLRNICYSLEYQCAPAKTGLSGESSYEPVAPAMDPALVRSQIDALEDKILFRNGDYNAYLIKASDAPAVMEELYRLREVTFREIGEGTGTPSDTDVYDAYYRHLILWSVPNGEIVGSYRVGYGAEIMAHHGGIPGFYSASLIDYGPDAQAVLSRSMELGRSFIVSKYQRDVLPLKMMLSGLCAATVQGIPVDSCVGLVSISDAMPDLLKSILVHFLERDFMLPDAERFARPTHPFQPHYLRVNPDDLLQIPERDIDSLDRLLLSLSDGKSRIPVLVRKYFSCGARVACFNVDPSFSNSLDAMIVLNLKDFPEATTHSFVRVLPKEIQDKVFANFYGSTNK